jgi:uncharacterized protein YciI
MSLAFVLALAWILALPSQAGSSQASRLEDQLTTYYLVLLQRGPNQDMPPDEAKRLQASHIGHLESLEQRGYGLAAGPLGDDGEIRGIVIMQAGSGKEAEVLAAEDPAVKAGRLVADVMPFMAPPGWFGRPDTPFQPEHLFFGFLKNGPNRGQDTATATELQKQHLAYMNGMAQQGKLVLAGPILLKTGDRRGVIAYRAATLDEAKKLAEGDPAVKAGRLVVELHPWMTAKGVLR